MVVPVIPNSIADFATPTSATMNNAAQSEEKEGGGRHIVIFK
jgi:hypothetical protein